jgi:phosphatidylserine decarboxylase
MRQGDETLMTVRAGLRKAGELEELNFLLTNRIPRRLATRFMGWFSRIELAPVRAASMALWRTFCDVDLSDARKQSFASLHDCFVRELADGARSPVADPDLLASPCDAIVGACGGIEGDRLYQVKDLPYRLIDLLGDEDHAALYRDGVYVTLRLTAGMYHHFHAPHDLTVQSVRYIYGDTWNVNPVALKRVERLFCRNERAAIHARLAATGEPLTLVAVAAILVAGIRLPFLAEDLRGPTRSIPADAVFTKGERMGWFEHGSTIILFAPKGFTLCEGIEPGTRIQAGGALLRAP